jgi:hypothetical protein
VGPIDQDDSDYLLAYPEFCHDPNSDGVCDLDLSLPEGFQECFDQILLQAVGDFAIACSTDTARGALFIGFDPAQCY